jgi:electron transfer flavoprotein beta subunit
VKILVLLRRLRAKPDGTPASEVLGLCDEAALATALALRGTNPGAHVIALAAGPPERENAVLERALVLGANHALRVYDASVESLDYHGVARVLAGAAKHLGYDLLLSGDRSEDEVQGAVGPAVAEVLGIPHLTGIRDARLEGGTLLGSRRDVGVVRTLEIPLPALLTVTSFSRAVATEPTLAPTAPPIEVLDLPAIGLQTMELKHRDRCLGRAHPVRVVRNVTVVANPDELVARLRDDRLLG